MGDGPSRSGPKIVQLLREYTGRGPTKARTTISGDLVVCVLAGT